MPAGPEVEELPGVAGLGHEDADLFDAEAALRGRRRALRSAGGGRGGCFGIGAAVFAFAVHAVERGGDLGEFGDQFGVGGRAVEAEQHELAREVGWDGELVEAAGGDDDLVGAKEVALGGLGGDGLRVLGDVGRLQPGGALGLVG